MTRTVGTGALQASVICLGTGSFGTAVPESEAFGILDRYVELGGSVLDTAHVYAAWVPQGAGMSERTIGRWLRACGLRKRLVIGTKGGHPDLGAMDVPRLSPAEIRQDLSESLDRLGLDAVDLYWLHRDDPGTPAGEILEALEEQRRAGLFRDYGASNWSVPRLREAAVYAEGRGISGFCASQVAFSLAVANPGFDRSGTIALEDAGRTYHQSTGMPVFAYTSQAKGFFSGKYARDAAPADEQGGKVRAAYFSETNFRRLERANRLAARLGRTANEVALGYLLAQSFPVFPIVGPRSPGQIAASCRAADLHLTPEDVAYLEG